MRHALKLHPDSLCPAVSGVDVEVARPRAGTLALSYVVTGMIGDLVLPPIAASARADGLWRQTCFEAFVGTSADTAYYEFNLSPSMQWAAYCFDRYRSGMRVASEIDAPRIEVHAESGSLTLRAWLELDRPSLRFLPGAGGGRRQGWRLGLSAVIESASGDKSYWALAHPPGRPDFHHADCFALELS